MLNCPNTPFRQRWLAWLLIGPQLLVTLVFFIWPALESIAQSFYSQSFWGTISHYIGWQNYTGLLGSPSYWQSIGLTLFFSVMVTLLTMLMGLYLALLVQKVRHGKRLYRTLFIWPYAVAPAVAGVLFGFLFNPAIGIVTYWLQHIDVNWNYFINGKQALTIAIIGSAWQQISYNFLFFLAGLSAIPSNLTEAAIIDGTNAWQRFIHIVLPLLSPISFFLLVMNLIYAFFDTFGLISTLTQGGPHNSTNILVYKVYQDGFIGQQIGSSSAQSVILMITIALLTILQFKYVEKRVHYQ